MGHRIVNDPGEMCSILDHYGIDEALVYDVQMVEGARVGMGDAERLLVFCSCHRVGLEASPPRGHRVIPPSEISNPKQIPSTKSRKQRKQVTKDSGFSVSSVLSVAEAPSRRLHPTVPIVPPGTAEQPPPKELVDWLKASGIRAVRAFPAWHAFDFLPYCIGPLLEILEDRRVPVLVSYNAPGVHHWPLTPPWDHIERTARAFPRLPIVVVLTGMLQDRRWLPLLNECPNVRCDISCCTFGLIELVCRTLGPERLLFGSGFPCYEPGLVITWPRYADISEEAAKLIAGDNLRALIQAVRL